MTLVLYSDVWQLGIGKIAKALPAELLLPVKFSTQLDLLQLKLFLRALGYLIGSPEG